MISIFIVDFMFELIPEVENLTKIFSMQTGFINSNLWLNINF